MFPALWRREPVDSAGGSGGSADPGWARGATGGGGVRAPAASSSREVRSVAPAPPQEPVEGGSEPRPRPPPPGGEEDEELESHELPRGSSGAAALSPGAPASWQPPPPSPPPAQPAEPDGDEVLLRIPAFSRDLYLLLRRDGRFLAPRFAVEQRPSPGPGPVPTREAAAPRPPAPHDAACFYTGAVLRQPGSLASFSTCGGGLVSPFPSPALLFPCHSSLSPCRPGKFACTSSRSERALNFAQPTPPESPPFSAHRTPPGQSVNPKSN